MKNRIVLYIIYFMIMIIIATIFVLIKYRPVHIDSKVIDTDWYNYDSKTGYYYKINISNDSFNYVKFDNTSVQTLYDTCNKYTYDKIKKQFTLNCGEKILINSVNNDKLSISFNNKERLYFKNPFDSLNYEFEKYFNQSMSEYRINKLHGIEYIRINFDRLYELFTTKETQTFIVFGNNCSSTDCILFLDVLDKWIATNENIYYVNFEEFNDKQLLKLNKKDNSFVLERSYYNDIYPRIIITNNSKIVDNYQIKCKGFNCTKYIKY